MENSKWHIVAAGLRFVVQALVVVWAVIALALAFALGGPLGLAVAVLLVVLGVVTLSSDTGCKTNAQK